MTRRKRPILKTFFIDDVEKDILRENMARFGYRQFSTYARRMLLFPTMPIVQIDFSGNEQLLSELRRIGNNVNQVAKVANQTKIVQENQVIYLGTLVEELGHQLKEKVEMSIREIENYYGGHKAKSSTWCFLSDKND